MYKKLLIPLLLLAMLCGCASAAPAETTVVLETMPADASKIGNSSYRCVTGVSEEIQQLSETETAKVKVFAHKIYNPDGEYVVTLTASVTGRYSESEDTASIVSVSGTFSDAQKDGFTLSEHISGDTATIVMYWNQTSVCHFQYRVYSDGTMEFL